MVNREMALGLVFVIISSLGIFFSMLLLNMQMVAIKVSVAIIVSSMFCYILYGIKARWQKYQYSKCIFPAIVFDNDERVILDGMCRESLSRYKVNAKMTLTNQRLMIQSTHSNGVFQLDEIKRIELKTFLGFAYFGLNIKGQACDKSVLIDYASDWKKQIEALC